MRITLTGASGFIGRSLVDGLLQDGHELRVLGRRRGSLPASVKFWNWNTDSVPLSDSLEGSEAVINLVGEPVAQRWTDPAKRRMHDSRIDGTHHLVDAIEKLKVRPKVLISGSAIGYYGSRGDDILTEQSTPGQGFLADLTRAWEDAARPAETLGVRVVTLRIGLVLGPDGGALAQMLTPFRAGIGGRLGSGKQWMSWIHLDDIYGLIRFALTNEHVRGPLNATGPSPVTNAEFSRRLGAALHRPAILPVPQFALRLLFGEMSQVILASTRVLPRAAESAGYRFQFHELPGALDNVLARSPAKR